MSTWQVDVAVVDSRGRFLVSEGTDCDDSRFHNVTEHGANVGGLNGSISVNAVTSGNTHFNNIDKRSAAKEKLRRYTCKHCAFIASSKNELWAHRKVHLKKGTALECPQCAFVTKFKHHLDYHLNSHNGVKPFSCTHPNCAYRCINRSMLKSHMKSHVDTYQFRCIDCDYATKYAHSLKLHLRKYGHHSTSGHLGGANGRASGNSIASQDSMGQPALVPVSHSTNTATGTGGGNERTMVANQLTPVSVQQSNIASVSPLSTGRQSPLLNLSGNWQQMQDPSAVSLFCDTITLRRQTNEQDPKSLLDALYRSGELPVQSESLGSNSLRSALIADASTVSCAIGLSTARLGNINDTNVSQSQLPAIGSYAPAPLYLPKTAQLRVMHHFSNAPEFRLSLPTRREMDSELSVPFM